MNHPNLVEIYPGVWIPPLHILDLFSGLHGWSADAEAKGHIVRRVEWNADMVADLHADMMTVSVDDLLDLFPERRIDLVLASPPCTCFSVASIGHHWTGGKNAYVPKTVEAKKAIKLIKHTINLIEGINPRFWWLENPRGVLRNLNLIPNTWSHATVWYCMYGEPRAKPTDLWGRWPRAWIPRPECRNYRYDQQGNLHSPHLYACGGFHEEAPAGAKTGTQGLAGNAERSVIPSGLAISVLNSVERTFAQPWESDNVQLVPPTHGSRIGFTEWFPSNDSEE